MNHRYAVPLLLALACSANAQDLRLFEPIETNGNDVGPQPAEVLRPIDGLTTQPAYTLKSVSRFGDEVHAVLVNRAGESTRASWQPGQRTQVPGNAAFMIVGFEAGALLLAMPPMEPCMEARTSGISCMPGNVAALRLTTAAPLAVNGNNDQNQQARANNNMAVNGGNAVAGQGGTVMMGPDASGPTFFINPFNGEPQAAPNLSPDQQALLERQQQRAARLRNVEAVRIDESNVPEGMRLVRTPFGDRLVPVRE